MNLKNFSNIRYRLLNKIIKKLIVLKNKLEVSFKDKLKFQEEQRWQSLFLENDSFIYSIGEHSKMLLYKDSILSRLIYNGFETEEINFLRKNLNEGDTFVDVGANVGIFSIIASEIVGVQGKVISFEPTPTSFNRLKENISLNGSNNVECRNIALSDRKGIMDFNISDSGFDAWNSFAKVDDKLQQQIVVSVSTLDAELQNFDKESVKFVKIDVEGWEKFVLLGGAMFFKTYSPMVMIEFTEQNTFQAGYIVQELFSIMEDWGYNWHRIEDGKLVPEKMRLRYPYDNLIALK
jgi:FkbM family methyltransferase